MMNLKKTFSPLLIVLAFACEQDRTLTPLDDSPVYLDLPAFAEGRAANGREGKQVVVYSAEYITAPESDQIGRTVFFNNVGNKRLGQDFVPGYSVDGSDNVSYYIDQSRPSQEVNIGVSSAAITRAMTTWDNLTCSDLGLFQIPFNTSKKTGFVAAILEPQTGIPGGLDIVADVVHAGWLPAPFFDAIAPGGSQFILGVTFTLIYTEGGQPTDIDNNGRLDVAFREIYYNDAFTWADGARFDIETIALHEAGHGLSQGHFGQAFRTISNGQLHFSPRAVMNAAYSGVQTAIDATDNAGHCSNWGSWPNN